MFQVVAPILKNEKNLTKFPQCVADDIKRQVHELSTSVYQIRGHIKGKTLLPFPQVITHFWTTFGLSHVQMAVKLKSLFSFCVARSQPDRGGGKASARVKRGRMRHGSQKQHRGYHHQMGISGTYYLYILT